jgi:orotate phosphoribosyltransferase
MNDQALIQRICDAALLRGTFTLRSGRVSNYYLDKYLFETQPDILAELGRRFAERVEDGVNRLAGAELGGIPLVASAAMASGLPCVLERNQKKEYGTAKQLEGKLEDGDKIMIVEDVVTSGGQVLESADVLKQAGAEIIKIVAVIDREEGGRENIESAGYRFEALLTKTDLGINE